MSALSSPTSNKWPKPNYTNPQTHGSTLCAVSVPLLVLAVTAVTLRLYTRIKIKRCFGLDDAFLVLALLITIGLNVVVNLSTTRYKWNRHIWDLPVKYYHPNALLGLYIKVFFHLSLGFIRISLLCSYYRLIRDTGKLRFRWLLHGCVATVIVTCIVLLVFSLIVCRPIRALYTFPRPPGTKCFDEAAVANATGAINNFCDLLVWSAPIPLVLRLNIPRARKVGVGLVFALGFVAVAAGLVRTGVVVTVIMKDVEDKRLDQSWTTWPLYMAAIVETNLALICASLPPCLPLFQLLSRRMRSHPNGPVKRTRKHVSSTNGSAPKSEAGTLTLLLRSGQAPDASDAGHPGLGIVMRSDRPKESRNSDESEWDLMMASVENGARAHTIESEWTAMLSSAQNDAKAHSRAIGSSKDSAGNGEEAAMGTIPTTSNV